MMYCNSYNLRAQVLARMVPATAPATSRAILPTGIWAHGAHMGPYGPIGPHGAKSNTRGNMALALASHTALAAVCLAVIPPAGGFHLPGVHVRWGPPTAL